MIFQKKKKKRLQNIVKNKKSINQIKNLVKSKTYHDYDDHDYKGIRDIETLFSEINEDYYKPVKLRVLLAVITQNMKAEGTKTKNYQLNNIFS